MTLHQIAGFFSLLCGAAVFVQQHHLNFQAVDAFLAIRDGYLPLFKASTSSLAPLAADTPNGPAAAPDKKVTTPMRYLPLSAALREVETASSATVAAMTDKPNGTRGAKCAI